MNQSLKTSYLELDIAFTGFVPNKSREDLDFETYNFLTNIEIWESLIKNLINYMKI